MPTTWTPEQILSTDWAVALYWVVYDEAGKTYDTLSDYYDGYPLVWTPASIGA